MIVKNLFLEQKEFTIQDIIDKATLDQSKKAEILYVVWYMIGNHYLIIEIQKPLSMDIIVRLN